MKLQQVDFRNLPKGEVLAISKTKDFLVGYLIYDGNKEKKVDCEDDNTSLLNVEFYIECKDILKIIK